MEHQGNKVISRKIPVVVVDAQCDPNDDRVHRTAQLKQVRSHLRLWIAGRQRTRAGAVLLASCLWHTFQQAAGLGYHESVHLTLFRHRRCFVISSGGCFFVYPTYGLEEDP